MWVLATNMRATKSSSCGAHAGLALAAAPLGAERGQGHALDPALVGDGDDHVLALDQLLDVDVGLGIEVDEGAARGVEQLLDPQELGLHHLEQPLARAQDQQQLVDLGRDLLQLVGELVALERGQPLQAQSRMALACSSESR